jgi:hypothetical protein
MSRLRSGLKLLSADLPLWILGLLFIVSGVVLAGAGLNLALADLRWSNANTTTGRVMITEWKRAGDESRLNVVYGYKDERGVIYHNTAVLARKLGKINLEPAAPVVVLFRPEDHSQSRMQLELGAREWIPILAIGPVEIVCGAIFLTVAIKRLLERLVKPAGAKTEEASVAAGTEAASGDRSV